MKYVLFERANANKGTTGSGRNEGKSIANCSNNKHDIIVDLRQGAQGETGTKGERGDPGLPVRLSTVI